MHIELDLYELYKERMGDSPKVEGEVFYIFLRLALACDVVHDFIEPRGKAGVDLWKEYLVQGLPSQAQTNAFEAYKKHFLTINADRVIRDCGQFPDLLDKIITGSFKAKGSDITQKLISLFDNEKTAKKTIDNIHYYLGIQEQNTIETMVRANKCSDFSVLDLMKAFTPINPDRKRKQSFTDYNITIDTASDKTNLIPFLSELMNRLYKTKNNCINLSSRVKVINSYATDYDASNENALSKVFKSLELTEDIDHNLTFFIKCQPDKVVFAGLLGEDSGNIRLGIMNYFTERFVRPLESSSNGSDSVNTITKKMLMSYKAQSNPDELFNLTIFKTMGDFLQIMTHLALNKSRPEAVNVFVTFDTICAKIAGMLDKKVFYEKKFTSEQDKLSGGLYTFYTIDQYTSVLTALGLMSEGEEMAPKRKKTEFGKKPKVKNLSNKSIVTKLKSVGIKITKKQGKRRVYLSRSELIKRATTFKKLQLRSKKLKVRIMYKDKRGKYVYKTAKRLMNEIKRQKQMKKPVKKPTVKQIKQKFG
tara:strand:- start:14639 stop:16237 length:1599 start_codon:yes stop_codon:yes gene_type:complete